MDESRHSGSPAEQDSAIESALLQQVLAAHPAAWSFEELLREMAGERAGFAERDALERAVRDLAAAGLLSRSADRVLPTRAALRFDELLGR